MFGFAAEPIAICNEIQSSSQLIDFERFSNFHFAVTRDNCGRIFSFLTIILRNRAEYRLILSRRGRRPSRLKSDDIPRD